MHVTYINKPGEYLLDSTH